MTLDVPRDRAGTFNPKLIAKYQRRFPNLDEKIILMYARGMTAREIREHLEELYGIDVSLSLISAITDAVLEKFAEWQGRTLDGCYPLVFSDGIRIKIRDGGFVRHVHRDGQADPYARHDADHGGGHYLGLHQRSARWRGIEANGICARSRFPKAALARFLQKAAGSDANR